MQARANDLGQKFSTDPIRKYYPGVASKSIFDRLRRLAAVHEDAPYLDALQTAWKEIWLDGRKSGRLPDDDWSNLNGRDLGKHRSYLCAKLNKQAMYVPQIPVLYSMLMCSRSRFQAMAPKGVVAAAQKDLPSDPEELLEKVQANALRPLSAREDAYAFDYLWATWITAAVKLQDYRYSSFTTPNARAPAYQQAYSSSDRRKLFTEKSVCPKPLIPLELTIRSFRYDYQARLPDTTLSAAQTFEKTLAKEGEIEWQNITEDGDMLALTHLFSDNLVCDPCLARSGWLANVNCMQVDFKIDTASTRDSRPYTDYRTRKIGKLSSRGSLIVADRLHLQTMKTWRTIFRSRSIKLTAARSHLSLVSSFQVPCEYLVAPLCSFDMSAVKPLMQSRCSDICFLFVFSAANMLQYDIDKEIIYEAGLAYPYCSREYGWLSFPDFRQWTQRHRIVDFDIVQLDIHLVSGRRLHGGNKVAKTYRPCL